MNTLMDLFTPTSGTASSPAGFVAGTVSDNGNKQYPGMVKVNFTAWEKGKSVSSWLPVMHSYAGDDYGSYLLPEVGDTVIVGFLGAFMQQPFVMGTLFPKASAFAKNSFQEKNLKRAFKTKGGITVDLSDESGKESLRLATPKGLHVQLDDNAQEVSLSDKDGKNKLILSAKNGSITLEASQKLVLKAGSCEVTLEASGGKLTINTIEAGISGKKAVNVAAQGELKLNGATSSLQGQQVSVNGNVMCEVKGGILKLN